MDTEITRTDIVQFFEEREKGLSRRGFCEEAEFSYNTLRTILERDGMPRQSTIDKLLPFMRKYGFQK
jgi:lambda repressor-like predicted transcriptional regulator